MNKDHISICICTYHRNNLLANLLKKIKDQETDNLFDFSIIVIDNDPDAPAKEIVDEYRNILNLNIIYDVEPIRSIPAARNHAIYLATGNYIAIIDDDEFPPSQWLITLLKAIKTFNVDGALGPVYPFFDHKPPNWIIKGKFCERPIYRTGSLLEWYQTRTGNVLLKKKVFDDHNLRFDLKLKTGSSDREFFKRATQLGYKFVFVAEAPVYEIIPPERWKKIYYIKRSVLNGYNTYLYSIKGNGIRKQFASAIKSIIALMIFAILFPFSLFLGPRLYVRILEKGAYHLSQLLARLGIELIKNRDF
jgi:glycosyltransferase involved in cell wall biosynthesis